LENLSAEMDPGLGAMHHGVEVSRLGAMDHGAELLGPSQRGFCVAACVAKNKKKKKKKRRGQRTRRQKNI
jgi:hypothetical protein